MTTHLFIEPLDVLFLRGNKLFGDAGSYGESLVPPWPSVVAGALRSHLLVERHPRWCPAPRAALPEDPDLGTPDRPGAFTVQGFFLARRSADERVELLVAPPADLVATKGDGARPTLRSIRPVIPCERIESSSALPLLPVLAQPRRAKPEAGCWLSTRDWARYLAGETLEDAELVYRDTLWKMDERIGVGLDPGRRRAHDGRLFSAQAAALRRRDHGADHDVGFLAVVEGIEPPRNALLRFGGDGRAAVMHVVEADLPAPDYDSLTRACRCRLVLTSPGLFAAGWLPTGGTPSADGVRFDLHGVRGHIVCAAVPRAEVVSGWDLARWRPKPARRAAPTGSVYWLELDDSVSAADLRRLVQRGLWSDAAYESEPRRAEGFNRLTLAAWT